MKEKVFALFLLFLPVSVIAQSAQPVEMEPMPPKTKYIKVYNLVSASRSVTEPYMPANRSYTYVSSFRIWNPALAAGLVNKKGNAHEVELTSVSINASDSRTTLYVPGQNISISTTGSKIYETHFALRYEYILNLVKKPGARLVPSVGFAASPYYIRYNLVPYTTAAYPAKDTYIGMRMFVAPRICYNLRRNLFLDLNIPFCLADLNYNNHKEQNPTVPSALRTTSTANFTALPKYFSARLGIGLRI